MGIYDYVIIILQGRELLLQDQFPSDLVGELWLCAGEIDVAGCNEKARDLCGQDGLLERCVSHHYIIHLTFQMPFVNTQASAGRPLGVEVD